MSLLKVKRVSTEPCGHVTLCCEANKDDKAFVAVAPSIPLSLTFPSERNSELFKIAFGYFPLVVSFLLCFHSFILFFPMPPFVSVLLLFSFLPLTLSSRCALA